MINSACYDKPVIFLEAMHLSLSRLFLKLYEFIKAVSDTVFDMINSAYYDKPLIFLEAIRLSLLRLLLTLYLT